MAWGGRNTQACRLALRDRYKVKAAFDVVKKVVYRPCTTFRSIFQEAGPCKRRSPHRCPFDRGFLAEWKDGESSKVAVEEKREAQGGIVGSERQEKDGLGRSGYQYTSSVHGGN